jgi:hypothetical protein
MTALEKSYAVDSATAGILYPDVVKFLHTLPFGLFLFTYQPVSFLQALTAKPGISALSLAVLPVPHRTHRFFFSQLFFRRIKLVNLTGYGSKSFSPFQPATGTVQIRVLAVVMVNVVQTM